MSFLSGHSVAVMGLGKSGMSAAKALTASGAEVWAWDDNEERRRAAADEGVPLIDLHRCDWAGLRTLVLSPGIAHTHPKPHPVVERARAAGAEIISDIELLARAQRDTSYIGVTGTNGKSTTVALIGHILGSAGRAVAVGGNFGPPALALEPLGRNGTYVLELSSYQLELVDSIAFDVSVLLNISPDHLDRHGGMEGYAAAKRRIFARQRARATAVIGVDDDYCRAIHAELEAAGDRRAIPVSGNRRVPGGVYVVGGVLHDHTEAKAAKAADISGVASLPGVHNWQNAAAAYATARAVGVGPAQVAACLPSFPGLAHRQELVAVIDGVACVNDSKATNAGAASRALACYSVIYWIAGGRPKEGGISSLEPYFSRVAHAFLIGEATDAFADALDGKVAYTKAGDLATAVRQAHAIAVAEKRPGAVVVLSPACASFDQFEDFEARGEAFRALVEALPGKRQAHAFAAAGAPAP